MSDKKEMPEGAREEYLELLAWINDHEIVSSLLYDLDRLPEQLEEGSKEWCEMVNIVTHMRVFYDEGASAANTVMERVSMLGVVTDRGLPSILGEMTDEKLSGARATIDYIFRK